VRILTRAEVVKRQAHEHHRELAEALARINDRLKAAKELPIKLTLEEMGAFPSVRSEVVRLLKEQGGFPVLETRESLDGPVIGYEVA
jgi:hypothetical protein